MVERKWLPAEWMDETVPTLGSNPADFLKRNTEGVLMLTPIDGKTDDPDEWPPSTPIQPGAVSGFCWTEQYGAATLTVEVGEDGRRWRCDVDYPDTATHFAISGDWDTMTSSIEALVTGRDGEWGTEGEGLDAGEYVIEAWTWSDPVWFRVKVLESGDVALDVVAPLGMDAANALIATERQRQIDVEGWTVEHDDQHVNGELRRAASAYLYGSVSAGTVPTEWPWAAEWWKPKGEREDLIRSGALCLAERDRLGRQRAHEAQYDEVDRLLTVVVRRLAGLPS